MATFTVHACVMTTHTETLSTTPNDHTNDPPNRATDADVIGVDHVTGAPLDPGDPRIAFAHAVQTAGAVVGRVDQDNAHDPSPCARTDTTCPRSLRSARR